jgi:hypothetical protein
MIQSKLKILHRNILYLPTVYFNSHWQSIFVLKNEKNEYYLADCDNRSYYWICKNDEKLPFH